MKKLLFLLTFLVSITANAATVKNLVVFGDSLSDNGNLYEYMNHKVPGSPPYFGGRFSNGLVWPELLMDSYFPNHGNHHLLNYAFGGAGIMDDDDGVVFTLQREIDIYLLAHQDKAAEDSLFVVWIGANNYLGLPENPEQVVEHVAQGITDGLRRLAAAGAHQVVIVNLPDLGKVPMAGAFDAREQLTDFTHRHNAAIARIADTLREEFPGVKWVEFDANGILDDIIAHPSQYGFENVTDTCYESITARSANRQVLSMVEQIRLNSKADKCETYLFFDPVHPVTKAHKIMAQKAREVFDGFNIRFQRE